MNLKTWSQKIARIPAGAIVELRDATHDLPNFKIEIAGTEPGVLISQEPVNFEGSEINEFQIFGGGWSVVAVDDVKWRDF